MEDAPPLEDDVYAEFYKVDEPVIKFLEGINEIQHIRQNVSGIAEEQAKDKVWSKVIIWVVKGQLLDKEEMRRKLRKVLAALQPYSVPADRWCTDVHQVCKQKPDRSSWEDMYPGINDQGSVESLSPKRFGRA